MTNPIAQKVALVTGGARGIGRAIALALSRDHSVAITHRTTAPTGLPVDMLCIEADLADVKTHGAVVRRVLDRFGRIDLVVNNAGTVAPSSLESVEYEAYRAMFDVNVLAPHGLLAAALPHLAAGSAVINISSVNAVLPPRGASLFGASKAALELWTRGMAKELGPRGIRVNGVAPGAIDVEDAPRSAELRQLFIGETALGRLGTPEDIAAVVCFLASDQAAFMTGEVLTVSGGYRL
ncbi:SDR family NAD(P)-dependent oxidoreductase [Tateyamaria pelophila]|uniref:SDR family NAD(P)-dependent oxidoreductase n=1 Tax=Tateyamaria pelophila TaxID=328415 RepID=UPI001CBAE30C|nr:SDR family oxidoreductase [Tateyamaria pelophila]